MTDSETFAWIFLSVPKESGTLQDIIAMADAINHAIPTHKELQTSLGWLQARGLVRKKGKHYSTTELGLQLLGKLRAPKCTMMQAWDLVAKQLESFDHTPASLDDITQQETTKSYNAYKKAFWKAYRELERKEPIT